jgi:hypothetical protein
MMTNQRLFVRLLMAAVFSIAIAATGCSDDGGGGGDGGGGAGGDGGGGGDGGTGGDGGMGGEGGMGGTGGGLDPCTDELCVDAVPGSTSFEGTLSVELVARGTASEDATIYYTTDLEEPGEGSPEYDGTPISISETTVVKFKAVAASGAGGAGGDGGAGGAGGAAAPEPIEAEGSEGYTLAEGPAAEIYDQWSRSGHGDMTGEPFRHWDEDGAVDPPCTQCHTAQGFLEYASLGLVETSQPLPLGLECQACHTGSPSSYYNPVFAANLEPVAFPVNAAEDTDPSLSLFGSSNMCLVCHQGRGSGPTLQNQIDGGNLGFLNIHYYAAAASLFGGEAQSGYEYEGNEYIPRNTFPSHPDEFSTCEGCHMINAENGQAHTWIPDIANCQSCHGGGDDGFETLGGSPGENYQKIDTLGNDLYAAIQDYAENTLEEPILYDSSSYPYWFYDNGQGANYGNRYQDFDETLLKCAYNYHLALSDPNGAIHNGSYIQQLLYDSTEACGGLPSVAVVGRGDLTLDGSAIGTLTSESGKTRQWQLSGHGAAAGEPFRHWDEDTIVSGSCTRCHNTNGFGEYAMGEETTAQLPLSTVGCTSCHNQFNLYDNPETRYDASGDNPAIQDVEFPSGATASLDNSSNICIGCHQGRASGVQVETASPNDAIQDPDYDSYSFINIHYYAAGATFLGSDVNGGYEYEGEQYRGQNQFGVHRQLGDAQGLVDCIGCHLNANPDEPERHTFLPKVADCNACHAGGAFETLRGSPGDNFADIETLKSELLAAIKAYATTGDLPISSPITYSENYPYWCKDNGEPCSRSNAYVDADFLMSTAMYNYHLATEDPAGYIHNGAYIIELLYDSIVAMGGTPSVPRI